MGFPLHLLELGLIECNYSKQNGLNKVTYSHKVSLEEGIPGAKTKGFEVVRDPPSLHLYSLPISLPSWYSNHYIYLLGWQMEYETSRSSIKQFHLNLTVQCIITWLCQRVDEKYNILAWSIATLNKFRNSLLKERE